MNNRTRLAPLPIDRAEELQRLLRSASEHEKNALAIDNRGRVRGVTHVDDTSEESLLGDFDVHA